MKQISKKTAEFNDFRFEGLNWRAQTNKYYTMDRVSADESKIVVKVGDSHILRTKNLTFEEWLDAAKAQDALVDEDGWKMNQVKWEI